MYIQNPRNPADYKNALNSWYGFLSMLGAIQQNATGRSQDALAIRKSYQALGYAAFALPNAVSELLAGYFEPIRAIEFSAADSSPDFLSVNHDAATVNQLNQDMIYYGPPAPSAARALHQLITQMQPHIEAALGTPFAVVCARAWVTKQASSEHGPIAFHSDGLSEYIAKS